MVESVPLVVEIGIFAYLVLVGAVGCYLQARVWRGKRRQQLAESRGSSGAAE